MKNLRKLSRDNLKIVKGGITPECARQQAEATECYSSLAACDANSPIAPNSGSYCRHICNRYCY